MAGFGYQYQNLLDPRTSSAILSDLSPRLIFSGDDHDHCEYEHPNGSREFTVGTLSWMQGNRVPSASLLTVNALEHAFDVCELPDQLFNYVSYAVLLGASLLFMAIAPTAQACIARRRAMAQAPRLWDLPEPKWRSARALYAADVREFPKMAGLLATYYAALNMYYYYL